MTGRPIAIRGDLGCRREIFWSRGWRQLFLFPESNRCCRCRYNSIAGHPSAWLTFQPSPVRDRRLCCTQSHRMACSQVAGRSSLVDVEESLPSSRCRLGLPSRELTGFTPLGQLGMAGRQGTPMLNFVVPAPRFSLHAMAWMDAPTRSGFIK